MAACGKGQAGLENPLRIEGGREDPFRDEDGLRENGASAAQTKYHRHGCIVKSAEFAHIQAIQFHSPVDRLGPPDVLVGNAQGHHLHHGSLGRHVLAKLLRKVMLHPPLCHHRPARH
ncbi:hypothetical protein Vretimale_5058 [Volvox reticuliferus]|uniref:Uncharacterized protein n=1 Tax=Volvox reticuliferus TaxID=1737510 RepID=A0A8J4DDN9_9CHLO|nr:hypothetical protein Vretifemale_4086 [Volvox reticuliferus]GIL99992.1 hypothetical protein Vretimale_5058 [Volvox reticuliferus]